jgi:hypothetical protein
MNWTGAFTPARPLSSARPSHSAPWRPGAACSRPLRRWISWATFLGALGLGCDSPKPAAVPRVAGEFGVFYGGQVQRRREIPMEIDRSRQSQGFRLRLDRPAETALEVRWELGLPGDGRLTRDDRGRKGKQRKVRQGSARWRPGEIVFERALALAAGDPLGLWNIRVLLGNNVVIDRPFLIVDRAERQRRRLVLEAADAGI